MAIHINEVTNQLEMLKIMKRPIWLGGPNKGSYVLVDSTLLKICLGEYTINRITVP